MAVAALVSGSALLGLTGTASADPNASTIGFGHSTNTHAVWCVQHDLNYYMTHHPVNSPAPYGTIAEHGEWGNQTYNTVKWFQSEFYGTPGQLDIDGIVGQMTGSDLLGNGDPYYNGTPGAYGYCWQYIPGDIP